MSFTVTIFCLSDWILVFWSRQWRVGPAILFLKRGGTLGTISAGRRCAVVPCCQGLRSIVYDPPRLDRQASRLNSSPSMQNFLMVLLQQGE